MGSTLDRLTIEGSVGWKRVRGTNGDGVLRNRFLLPTGAGVSSPLIAIEVVERARSVQIGVRVRITHTRTAYAFGETVERDVRLSRPLGDRRVRHAPIDPGMEALGVD